MRWLRAHPSFPFFGSISHALQSVDGDQLCRKILAWLRSKRRSTRVCGRLWSESPPTWSSDTRICGRQSVGGVLFRAQQSRDRYRLRSWLYHHIDALGGLCRFYLSSAPSTLAPKEQRLLMRHHLEIACWRANDRIGQDEVRDGGLAGRHL